MVGMVWMVVARDRCWHRHCHGGGGVCAIDGGIVVVIVLAGIMGMVWMVEVVVVAVP